MNASTSAKVLAPTVKLLINGKLVESQSTQWRDVVNPATQEVLARVPFATPDEVNAAVANAKEAFKTWRKTPIGQRARIFLKLQQRSEEHTSELQSPCNLVCRLLLEKKISLCSHHALSPCDVTE